MARSQIVPQKYCGDDIPITIYLKTSSGAMSIDDLAELFIYIRLKKKSGAVAKFSKAGTQDDCTALVRVDATHYRADWKSADTEDADPGDHYLEINIVETDADYDSNEKNSIATAVVFELLDTLVKEQSS